MLCQRILLCQKMLLCHTAMPANAAMPANTAMPMFLTSCETDRNAHMEIWLRSVRVAT